MCGVASCGSIGVEWFGNAETQLRYRKSSTATHFAMKNIIGNMYYMYQNQNAAAYMDDMNGGVDDRGVFTVVTCCPVMCERQQVEKVTFR